MSGCPRKPRCGQQADGFVVEILARPDSEVEREQPLMRLDEPFLASRAAVLRAQLEELQVRYDALLTVDRAQAATVREQISVRATQATGRPVLIGTRSAAASEHLSELFTAAGLAHRVLNARQDQEEAGIFSRAGEPARITVATNMAGRGTDIQLVPGVVASGGRHVIASERHDARRTDRQIFGRCGRQGDPDSFQV